VKYKITILIVCMIFLIGNISAANFDNTKSFDKSVGKYGKIKLKDWFGLLDLEEIELKSNTRICKGQCIAEKEVVMHQNGVLVDDVRFIDMNTGKETDIVDYQFQIWNGNKWETYNHQKLKKGNYKLRLLGKLRPYQTVDWQIKSQGIWIEEWDIWSDYLSDQLIEYFNLDDDGGGSLARIDLSGDATNFTTGGKMQGYFNFSGQQFLNSTTNDLIKFHQNVTVSFWANVTSGSDSGFMFSIMRKDTGNTDDYTLRCFSHTDNDMECNVWTDTAEYSKRSTDPLSAGDWQHIVLVYNGTTLYYYVNGTFADFIAATDDFSARWGSNPHLVLGDIGIAYNNKFEGGIDEFAIWNRSLNSSEVTDLWNGSAGIEFTGGAPTVNLNNPDDNNFTKSNSVTFNCSATRVRKDGVQVDNLTLIIDGVANTTITGSSKTLSLEKIVTMPYGNHTWTCNATDSDNRGDQPPTRSLTVGFLEISQTFNSTTFEGNSERFILNFTYNSSAFSSVTANFYYSGTPKLANLVGSGDNALFQYDLEVPFGNLTNEVQWEVLLEDSNGINKFNATSNNQSVEIMLFGLCNTTLNVPYINFTFKNETLSEEFLNASVSSSWVYYVGTNASHNKTLSLTNATENPSYAFCFTPSYFPMTTLLDMSYTNTASQQRTFSPTLSLSNTTNNQVLYLLPTVLGIFSPFVTQDSLGNSISLVKATITRVISGSTISVTSDFTDDSGFLTFFFNPDATYTALFEKAGFSNNQFTFVPNSDTRTVTMGSTTQGVNGSTVSENIISIITPSNSSLPNQTEITFGFNVSGTNVELNLITMNITNSSGTSLGYNSNSGEGFITITNNTGNNTRLIGTYTIQTPNETIVETKMWIVGTEFEGEYSLFRQFSFFTEYGFGDFIRLLIILLTIIGVILFMSSNEVIETSESKVIVVTLILWAFSIVGWLNNPSTTSEVGISQFSRQYGIAILSTMLALFLILRRLFIRRI